MLTNTAYRNYEYNLKRTFWRKRTIAGSLVDLCDSRVKTVLGVLMNSFVLPNCTSSKKPVCESIAWHPCCAPPFHVGHVSDVNILYLSVMYINKMQCMTVECSSIYKCIHSLTKYISGLHSLPAVWQPTIQHPLLEVCSHIMKSQVVKTTWYWILWFNHISVVKDYMNSHDQYKTYTELTNLARNLS